MQSQQNHNDDISTSWNIISENKCCIMKSESDKAEDEFCFDINEQLT